MKITIVYFFNLFKLNYFPKKGTKPKSKILLLLIQYGDCRIKNLAKKFLGQVLSSS